MASSNMKTLRMWSRLGELWIVIFVCAASTLAQTNTFPASGNVGIGMTTPEYELDVNGPIRGAMAPVGFSSWTGDVNAPYGIGLSIDGNNAGIFGRQRNNSWPTYTDMVFYAGNDGDERFEWYPGVWTGAGDYLGNEAMDLNAFTGQLYVEGNVGIGTTNPHAPLEITRDTGAASQGTLLRLNSQNGAGGNGGSILFTNNGDVLQLAKITGVDAGAWGGYLTFSTSPNTGSSPGGNPTERMRIDNVGNIGIGTTSPQFSLDVAGQIHSANGIVFPDGTTQTTAFSPTICGGDYAESVDVTGSRTSYEPGDVLVIDPSAPGKFLKSKEPYSTLVTGIYSTKPGTVGRRQTTAKSPDEVPMAMMGIVPTKVSAENGPVKVGDLLVSSSKPGYAMKGTDRSLLTGAVIGKALGHLDSGTGVIEVVVTLQ